MPAVQYHGRNSLNKFSSFQIVLVSVIDKKYDIY